MPIISNKNFVLTLLVQLSSITHIYKKKTKPGVLS
jgi:hypothetical protein